MLSKISGVMPRKLRFFSRINPTASDFLMNLPLRFLIPAGVSIILYFFQLTSSQAADGGSQEGFSSRDKPGGHWYVDDIRTLSPVTHQGKHVVMTINNVLYEQVLQGDFVSVNTIQGTLTRHKRSDGTTTILQETLYFTSPTTIKMQWIALDSNSDLTMGRSGLTPAIWLPDPKPLDTQSVTPPPPPSAPPAAKPYDPMANID